MPPRPYKLAFIAGILLAASLAFAQDQTLSLDLPAATLPAAVEALAQQAGLQVLFDRQSLAGKQAPALKGNFTAREALAKLLAGSGLRFTFTASNAVAITVAPPVSAQPQHSMSAEEMPQQLQAVVVMGKADAQSYVAPNATTATKTDTPVMETPVSIQVVPQQVLQDQKADSLRQALVNVSGVVPTPQAAGDRGENFILRGFKSDGGPATYGGWSNNGNQTTDGVAISAVRGLAQMALLDSVEVLKGPAAILYGRMEPGGLVNLVSKKPHEKAAISIEQQVGSWQQFVTTLDATGPVDETNKLLYRVIASSDRANSWRQGDIYTHTWVVAPSVLWKVTPQTQLAVDLKVLESRYGEDSGTWSPWVNGAPTLPKELNLGEPSPASIRDNSIRIALDHRFDEVWSGTAKLQHADQRYQLSITSVDWGYTATGDGVPPWFVDRNLYFLSAHPKNDYASLEAVAKFDTAGVKHKLLLGADFSRLANSYWRESSTAASTIDPLNPVHPGPPLALDPATYSAGELRESQRGIYIQDQIDLPNNVFATLGLRSQRYTKTVPLDPASDRVETGTTPRLGVIWRARPWLSVYGSYAEGFGLGSGNRYPGTPMPATGAKAYEAGFKMESADGNFQSTIAVFDITKTTLPGRDPVHPTPPGMWSIPIGKVRSKGIELDASGELAPGWNAIATYSHTDARITKNDDSPWSVGDRLADVPVQAATLWTTYKLSTAALQGLKLGAGVNWRSNTWQDRWSDDAPQPSDTPGFALFNAMASYEFLSGARKWTAQLNVYNLLNKQYRETTGVYGEMAFLNYGAPRSIRASLKVDF